MTDAHQASTSAPEVSVVVPTFNDSQRLEANLPVLLQHLSALGRTWEVLVADDGSADAARTWEVAQASGCRYVRNDKHAGKGAAVRLGMLAARGAYRLFTDADIPYEPSLIDTFLRYLDDKEFDVVVGDRTLAGARYFDAVSKRRALASRAYSFAVGRFVAGGWYDTQCGLKGFRASAAMDLFGVSQIDGFAFDVEVIYIALKRNYDIKRLPVQLRRGETPTVSSVSLRLHSVEMLRDLGRIIANQYAGRYERRR